MSFAMCKSEPNTRKTISVALKDSEEGVGGFDPEGLAYALTGLR
jgi:hypothetical protein